MTSVSSVGNTINFSGGSVTISGNGATLTFCANVNIVGTNPGALVYATDGQVEIVGIWFSWPSGSTNVYDIFISGPAKLYALNLLLDCRNSATHIGLETGYGGRFIGQVADGDITGHISVIGGGMNAGAGISPFTYGNYYVMAITTPLQYGSCITAAIGPVIGVQSAQVNGASLNVGYGAYDQSKVVINILNVFNCETGLKYSNRGKSYRLLCSHD